MRSLSVPAIAANATSNAPVVNPMPASDPLNAPFSDPVGPVQRNGIIGQLQTLHADRERQRGTNALDLNVASPVRPSAVYAAPSSEKIAAETVRTDALLGPDGVARLPDRLDTAQTQSPQFQAMWQDAAKLFDELYGRNLGGANANYIQALSAQDTSKVGFSIVTPDGGRRSHRDGASYPVSIQSTSKLFDYLLACEGIGQVAVGEQVGAEYSPYPFNYPTTVGVARTAEGSLAEQIAGRLMASKRPESTRQLREQIEQAWPDSSADRRPANAMENFGAIATSARIPRHVGLSQSAPVSAQPPSPVDLGTLGQLHNTLELMKRMGPPAATEAKDRGSEGAGLPYVRLDHTVYASERTDSAGNETLARLVELQSAGQPVASLDEAARRAIVDNAIKDNDIYTANCSLQTHPAYLASLMACLANGGRNVFTNEQVIPIAHVDAVVEQMRVGGLYEASARFNAQTGLVAKSGVGGLVAAIDPRSGTAIATLSSPLNEEGNSMLGMAFLEALVRLPTYKAFVDYAAGSRDATSSGNADAGDSRVKRVKTGNE